MGKSLSEYIEWLAARPNLIWPKAPVQKPLNATPALKPLENIRAVSWCVYGTLLTIHDGALRHVHPQQLRMQVALQKTIDEFNMWNSMSRKPGQPWEYMLQQYGKVVEELQMASTKRKGDVPEVDSSRIWFKLIDRLLRNEYEYDRAFYGEPEQLAVKVAYFFHSMLQGVGMAPGGTATLRRVAQAGLRQGLIDDAQPFSLKQLQHALQKDDPTAGLAGLISPELTALSFHFGVKKPSPTLFAVAAEQYRQLGIEPSQVLYVSHRLIDDLAVARSQGFRTALYAADAHTCQVQSQDLKDPQTRPDRLITELEHVPQLLGV
ncbi:MAG: HAD hydrolase-like protein [Planctomyces sp.]|nr:HAD hydrolase-like protein [Planctomyces sp.]